MGNEIKVTRRLKKEGININVSIIEKDVGGFDWNFFKKEVRIFKKSWTNIGFFTTGGNASDDIATRAFINEFGATIPVTDKMRGFFFWKFKIRLKTNTIVIPERPFQKNTFDGHKRTVNNKIAAMYGLVVDGKLTARQALSQLGEWYSALMKLTIRGGNFHPNAPLTIKIKGSSKPLNDTGEMANSIEHRETIKE